MDNLGGSFDIVEVLENLHINVDVDNVARKLAICN